MIDKIVSCKEALIQCLREEYYSEKGSHLYDGSFLSLIICLIKSDVFLPIVILPGAVGQNGAGGVCRRTSAILCLIHCLIISRFN